MIHKSRPCVSLKGEFPLKEKKIIKIGEVLEKLRRKRLQSQEQLAELSNRDRR